MKQTQEHVPAMKEQLTRVHKQKEKKKNKKFDTHPMSPHPNPNVNELPPNLLISPSFAVTTQCS